MMKRFTITIFLFSVCGLLFSQVGSIGLSISSGGNLSYIFNSIAKYKSGITDIGKTTVGITINDNADAAYSQWTLTIQFEDLDLDGFITGSTYTLPFSTVEVSTSLAGCASCTQLAPAVPPYLIMSNVAQNLVWGGDGPGGADDIPPNLNSAVDKVLISYYIGTNGACPCPPGNSLLGKPADYYTDVIILTLTMQ